MKFFLVILTTVFCFQYNNRRNISNLCFNLLSNKSQISFRCNMSISNLQLFKISTYFFYFHFGSKNLKFYSVLRVKCSPNMKFLGVFYHFVWIAKSNYLCFHGDKEWSFIYKNFISLISNFNLIEILSLF